MPTLKDGVTAIPAEPNAFDHEITDMASYVHNYKVDSEVAVSLTIHQINESGA